MLAAAYLATGGNASKAAGMHGMTDHKRIIAAAQRCGVYVQKRGAKSSAPAATKPSARAESRSMLFDNELEDQIEPVRADPNLFERRFQAVEGQVRGLWKRLEELRKLVEALATPEPAKPSPLKPMKVVQGAWGHGNYFGVSLDDILPHNDDPNFSGEEPLEYATHQD